MLPMLGVSSLITLGMAPWATGILGVIFVLICLLLMLTVLIQRPQGGGLAGAFGSGAGSGQTAFGTKTGDALTIFTIVVFVLFVGMSIGLNFALRPSAPDPTPAASRTPGTAPVSSDQGAPADGAAPADQSKTEQPKTEAPKTDTPAAPAGSAPAATPATTPAPAGTTPAPAPASGTDSKPAQPAPKS